MHETRQFDRREFLRATGVVALAGVAARDASAASDSASRSTSEVVIGIDRRAASGWRATLDRAVPRDARVRTENPALGYVVVEVPERAATALAATDEVAYVEENARYHAVDTQAVPPNDPRYDDQYVPETIGAEDAWKTTTGDSEVTVAVIDSGVDYDHPDLAGNLRDDPGRDFVEEDDDPAPASAKSHGTEVAGIVGGVANNAEGVAGLSQSELIVGRVLDDQFGTLANIADGIQWAADEGADVINLSLGAQDDSRTMRRALAYATEKGALVIAAAGNSGIGGDVAYPAANEACLGVAALDRDGRRADFSTTGPEVGIAAPGVDVLTTTVSGGYRRFDGTSASTPVVSGVAALALARWDLTGPQLGYHLRATATDVGLTEAAQGAGRVDAAAAVNDLPKTLAIVGNDALATYEFAVDGRLQKGERANPEDAIAGTSASGAVQNGMDTYRFSGDVTGFASDAPVTVWINGQSTDYGDSTASEGPAALPGFAAPTDPDGDGRYEDVTGDGTTNVVDVQALFANRKGQAVTESVDAFDFTGDGSVNVVDVQKLFAEIT